MLQRLLVGTATIGMISFFVVLFLAIGGEAFSVGRSCHVRKSPVEGAVRTFCRPSPSRLLMAPTEHETPYSKPSVERHAQQPWRFGNTLGRSLASASLVLATTALPMLTPLSVQPSNAYDSRVIGQLSGSGLILKDTLQVESFDDPKIKGVTLYISTFQKPITERMTNFFSDPSYASVSCAKTAKTVSIADNINTSTSGEEVFEESRSLLFKTLRVQRLYDVEKKTVVYVSYNTRFDKSDDTNKSRFKSSLCAVNLDY
jgi:catabolite regulation protein CreA